MDPASVVGLMAACSSLTKQCASVVNTLHGLVETYKNAELAILSIAEECSTVEYAWRRIAEWAEGNLYKVEDFEELGERLQRSIYCGELVVSALKEEIMGIQSNPNSVKRRISLLWNNGIFVEHQTRLRGQVAALQLLLQVLSL
jgi:muconolactone delta-isomerase